MAFVFSRKPVALGNVTATLKGHKTVWHYRRLGSLEEIELNEDLRPFARFNREKAAAYEATGVSEQIESLGEVVEGVEVKVTQKMIIALEELQETPPPEIAKPVSSWVANLLCKVEGFEDEEGNPLIWDKLDREAQEALVDLLDFKSQLEIIARTRADSHLSEIELGKPVKKRGK